MSQQQHPVLPEELMAYIDGELAPDRAAMAAKHIEMCGECRQEVNSAGRLSREMAEWRVEEPSHTLDRNVLEEAKRYSKSNGRAESRFTMWRRNRLWAYAVAGGCAVVLVLAVVMTNSPSSSSVEYLDSNIGGRAAEAQAPADIRVENYGGAARGARGQNGMGGALGQNDTREKRAVASTPSRGYIQDRLESGAPPAAQSTPPDIAGPMIIRTVHMNIVTKEFDKARSELDTIVRNARGYLEQLQVRGEIGTGRLISATLRIPADRLDSSLAELRKLGHIQDESQSSSDVSSQYVDLEARLRNARNTEQRFLTMLRERTGNLKDVVEAEKEVSRVREEIERMDAQLKNLSRQVAYATVQLQMSEEFRANLEQQKLPSTGTRLGNAAVNGYKLAVETVVGVLAAILMFGPTLALVALVVGLAALLAWRIQKRHAADRPSQG